MHIYIYLYIDTYYPVHPILSEKNILVSPRSKALTIWYFVRPEQYSASLKPDSQVGKIGGIHQGNWGTWLGVVGESVSSAFPNFFCLGKKWERRSFGEKLREKF